ncbi:RelB/DinJ family addiction module antitoxin [Bartonella taylorii 8TBB]|uniref:RelB/DinJ family addiction module antitoxin n=1 Tax=Bartonella taylorii 8TBB TaxID=1094560 RepID=A0A9P2W235_BARTA|nr:type II toxin-antitoxin system RelB/DinJ family antitoxin [Bartonella taylorii]EJF92297.1 RelB/DinJ family addiction module antitoxin [Bartonella taylorii 8TBB]
MSVSVDSKDVVRARIDKNLKKEAHEILATLGLTVSDFIRIALTKVVNERGLPFDMYVPNAETLETFEKTNRSGDVFYAEDMDDLFKKLDI